MESTLDKLWDDHGIFIFAGMILIAGLFLGVIRSILVGDISVKEYFLGFFKNVLIILVLPVVSFYLSYIMPFYLIEYAHITLPVIIVVLLIFLLSGWYKKFISFVIGWRKKNKQSRKQYLMRGRRISEDRIYWLRHPWNFHRDFIVIISLIFYLRTTSILFSSELQKYFLFSSPLIFLLSAFFDDDEDFQAPIIYWFIGSYLFVSLMICFKVGVIFNRLFE